MTNSKNLQELIRKEAINELCRRDFWYFCKYYDESFFEKRTFLKQIADSFQEISEKKILRLAVSMPPRAGKSYITSLFCAWMLGKEPTGSIMRNCCTATLYEKFSYDVREIVKSDKFQVVFRVKLASDKQSLNGWNTSESIQVGYFGAGVGGTIIGFGATLAAITDDLLRSFEDAISEKILDKTHSWYSGTHGSRLEKNCPSIDIGTRWSKKDIIGIQEENKFYDKVIVIPALNEKEESFCEAVKTTAEYIDIRERNPPEIWKAEYMQQPIEASGNLFSKNDIKRFKLSDLKLYETINGKQEKTFESLLGYIDVADGGTDNLAFALAHIYNKKVFITDIVFSRENIDITQPQCAGIINKTNPDFIRIESNNQGGGFIRGLRNMVPPEKITGIKSTTNKLTRILMEYGFIKEYFYFRDDYEKNSEYDKFMNNFFDFTKYQESSRQKSQTDDAADCIAALSRMIQSFVPHLFK